MSNNVEFLKNYINEQIAKKGLDENGQIEIDFSDLGTEEETKEASQELGFTTEEGEGQGVWWLVQDEDKASLQKLLDKKFLSLEELEEVEESSEVQSVEDCGMSGQYSGKHWYSLTLQDGTEHDIYTD